MTRAGTQRGIAMQISGHTTEATFERYNIKDVEDTRQAMKAQAARRQAQPVEPSNVVSLKLAK